MATELELTSDCDEGYTTEVTDDTHLVYLKNRIIKGINDSNDFSAAFRHVPGQPAKLCLNLGSKSGKTPKKEYHSAKPSNKLLVKGLPETVDEAFLDMFFEHTKRQGGGPVKHVSLNNENKTAVIEFEEADAVNVVLKKAPIKMQGTTVAVEMYTPYLGSDEPLECIEVLGVPREVVKDIAAMEFKNISPTVLISPSDHFQCDGCGSSNAAKRYRCRSCSINFCEPCLCKRTHDAYHTFTDISPDKDILQSRHTNIWCNGCRQKPLVGTRFRCRDCPDLDFCESCKSAFPHSRNHSFVSVV